MGSARRVDYAYHELLLESPVFRVVWLDAARSIVMAHALQRWTWQDAHAAISAVNAAQNTVTHPVYTLLLFDSGTSQLPSSVGAITHLKRLMEYDLPHERLAVIVGQHYLLSHFITVTARIHGLKRIVGKYRAALTLTDALDIIARDRASIGELPPERRL